MPNLCDYIDAYIHVKGTITFPDTGKAGALSNADKKQYLKIVLHLLIA